MANFNILKAALLLKYEEELKLSCLSNLQSVSKPNIDSNNVLNAYRLYENTTRSSNMNELIVSVPSTEAPLQTVPLLELLPWLLPNMTGSSSNTPVDSAGHLWTWNTVDDSSTNTFQRPLDLSKQPSFSSSTDKNATVIRSSLSLPSSISSTNRYSSDRMVETPFIPPSAVAEYTNDPRATPAPYPRVPSPVFQPSSLPRLPRKGPFPASSERASDAAAIFELQMPALAGLSASSVNPLDMQHLQPPKASAVTAGFFHRHAAELPTALNPSEHAYSSSSSSPSSSSSCSSSLLNVANHNNNCSPPNNAVAARYVAEILAMASMRRRTPEETSVAIPERIGRGEERSLRSGHPRQQQPASHTDWGRGEAFGTTATSSGDGRQFAASSASTSHGTPSTSDFSTVSSEKEESLTVSRSGATVSAAAAFAGTSMRFSDAADTSATSNRSPLIGSRTSQGTKKTEDILKKRRVGRPAKYVEMRDETDPSRRSKFRQHLNREAQCRFRRRQKELLDHYRHLDEDQRRQIWKLRLEISNGQILQRMLTKQVEDLEKAVASKGLSVLDRKESGGEAAAKHHSKGIFTPLLSPSPLHSVSHPRGAEREEDAPGVRFSPY